MSIIQKENGHVDFNKTGYLSFVRSVRKSYNQYVDNVFEQAIKVYEALKKQSPAKPGETIQSAQKRKAKCFFEQGDSIGYMLCERPVGDRDMNDFVLSELFRSKSGKLTKPRRSAFPKLTNKQTSFYLFNDACSYWELTQSESGGVLEWHVSKDNHNVRDARNTPIYRLFINALKSHPWGRHEGGVFWYTDEFLEAQAESDPMVPEKEISFVWGPVGEAIKLNSIKQMAEKFSRG